MRPYLLFAICYLLCAGHCVGANRYAKNFRIETFDTHKLIHVTNPWRGAEDLTFTYALVPKAAASLPQLPDKATLIRTPVERVVTMATTYFGYIQELDLRHSLVGIANLNFTNDPVIHQLVEDGKVKVVKNGSSMNLESIMMLRPDLILTSSTGNPTFDVQPHLARAGLPVALSAGYMEAHPLARTEWIKVFAAFYEREADAESFFNEIAQRYEALAALCQDPQLSRPTVFCNAPYGGVWHIPGGQSYSAQALRDAGANYLWQENPSSGGVPMDFEAIYYRAKDADFWLNPSHYASLQQLLQTDERYLGFAAIQTGRVYNNTKRLNAQGGNDIWERGIAHPEEILADLIKIFHPELMPDHDFVFYEKLK